MFPQHSPQTLIIILKREFFSHCDVAKRVASCIVRMTGDISLHLPQMLINILKSQIFGVCAFV